MILPRNNYAFTSQYLCFCNLLILNPLQKHFSFLSQFTGKSNIFSSCSRAFGLFRIRSKSITDSTDATDFIFSRISFGLGFFLDFIAPVRRWIASSEGKIRKNPCALAHIIQMHRIKISERTDPSHRCYP
mgnify:FL=1